MADIARLSALLAGMVLIVLGNGLQNTLLGVRAGLEGMSAQTVGWVMSAYFGGFAIGSMLVPRLVERAGHIRAFVALASLASSVALAHAIIVDASAWFILRLVHGACFAGLILIVESWLNAATDRKRRGRVLAVYSVLFFAATALSQPLLNLASPSGFVLFCVVSILLSLALVPIALMRAGGPGFVTAERSSLHRLYEASPVALVGAFVVGILSGALWGMGPTYGQKAGLSEEGISVFVMLTTVGALVSQWPVGWLSDLVDRRWVILGNCTAGALTGLVFWWLADTRPLHLFVLAFLYCGFTIPIYSLVVEHLNDHVETGELIAAASGLLLVYGVGAGLGPVSASFVMSQLGPNGLFIFSAGVLVAFAIFTIYRMIQEEAVQQAIKDRFVGVPSTTHAHLPLHRHGPGRGPGRRSRA